MTRLLLIEDYAVLAEVTAEFIRTAGFEVWIAGSGAEGLVAAAAFHPEIVLCDLSLPDMSGLNVARELRANPDTKDVVFALHTSVAESGLRELKDQLDVRVNLFLAKPLTMEMLDKLLAELNTLPPTAHALPNGTANGTRAAT